MINWIFKTSTVVRTDYSLGKQLVIKEVSSESRLSWRISDVYTDGHGIEIQLILMST